jgi:hypothetical protein
MIALLTDFGLHGPYTGQMKAVLHQMAPGIPAIDLFADAPVGNPIRYPARQGGKVLARVNWVLELAKLGFLNSRFRSDERLHLASGDVRPVAFDSALVRSGNGRRGSAPRR